jgi:hypothetical protein
MLPPIRLESKEIVLRRPTRATLSAHLSMLLTMLLATGFWPSTAIAWNANGHKATLEIAFGLLPAEQRDAIGNILRAHPRFAKDFAAHMPDGIANGDEHVQMLWIYQQASIWPDILRNLDEAEQDKYGPANWHYINMPVYLEDEDERQLDGKLRHNMSTKFEPPLRRDFNIVQALKGNLRIWNDDKASDAEKAIALCWIFHLVGDLHQPLHTVALFSRADFPQGDRGGNSVEIQWSPDSTNLHAVWDNLPDRIENLEPGDLTRDVLRTDVVSAASIDYWLMRHTQLAKALVYPDEVRKQLTAGRPTDALSEIELSEFYLSTNALVAKEQIILAGHRVASLLE